MADRLSNGKYRVSSGNGRLNIKTSPGQGAFESSDYKELLLKKSREKYLKSEKPGNLPKTFGENGVEKNTASPESSGRINARDLTGSRTDRIESIRNKTRSFSSRRSSVEYTDRLNGSVRARDLSVRASLMNDPTVIARRTSKMNDPFSDELIKKSLPGQDTKADAPGKDPRFAKNGLTRKQAGKPQKLHFHENRKTISFGEAKNAMKNARKGKQSTTSQLKAEAKKSVKEVKNQIFDSDKRHANEAVQEDAAKKKKTRKTIKNIITKPITVPAGFGLGLAVTTSVLPIILALAPILALISIIIVLCNFFFSSEMKDDSEEKSLASRIERSVIGEDLNYAQYIVDETRCLDDDFRSAAKNSATFFFMEEDNKIPSQGDDKKSLKIPWYCSVKSGEIGHTWMREECDNTTKLATSNGETGWGSGKTFYNQSVLYEGDDDKKEQDPFYGYGYRAKDLRTPIPGTAANLCPILSMAHYRYDGEWDFDNYLNVMAYTYSMYVGSHDLARFDSNALDHHGKIPKVDDRWKTAFYYTPARSHTREELYRGGAYVQSGFSWGTGDGFKIASYDPETHEYDSIALDVFAYDDKDVLCDNVYFHGYPDKDSDIIDTFFQKAYAKLKKKTKSILKNLFGADKVSDDNEYGIEREPITGSNQGLEYINMPVYVKDYEAGSRFNPYIDIDNDGEIDNVAHYCDNPGYIQLGVTDIETGEDYTVCGLKQHIHEPGCYSVSPDVHIHDDSCWGYIEEETDPEAEEDEEEEESEESGSEEEPAPKERVLTCGHESDGYWEWEITPLTQDEIDATIPDDGVGISEGPADTITNADGITYVLSCEEKYHKHQDWVSNKEPGCWQTGVICLGHCGGHIQPYVNVAVDYTYGGLSLADPGVDEPSFMSSVDFETQTSLRNDVSGILGGIFDKIDLYGRVSVEKGGGVGGDWKIGTKIKEFFSSDEHKINAGISWKKYWGGKIKKWYRMGPNNPVSFVCFVGKEFVYTGATFVDFFNGQAEISDLGDRLVSSADNTGLLGNLKKWGTTIGIVDAKDEDVWLNNFANFDGWWAWDGSKRVFEEGKLSDLVDLYGIPKDNYKEGKELWEEFGVKFPLGGDHQLTEEQIQAILEAIDEAYPGLFDADPARYDVCYQALYEAGLFYYQCDYESHMNGCLNPEGGPAECTGWASGCVSRALDGEGVSAEYPMGRSGFLNPSTGVMDGNYAGVHCYIASPSKHSDAYTGVMTPWTNMGIRPGGSTTLYGATSTCALPGDVLVNNGHVLIYMGVYTDPVTGMYNPKGFQVECYGGHGSDYHQFWYKFDGNELLDHSYPAMYRPPAYTIRTADQSSPYAAQAKANGGKVSFK